MSEKPRLSDVVAESALVEQHIPQETTLNIIIETALSDVKRYLKNKRGIEWTHVYDSDNDVYFPNSDGVQNNADQLKKAISLQAVALVYKLNAQNAQDSMWWDMYKEYRAESESLLDDAKLDIDSDESGDITSGEDDTSAQVFFSR